MHGLRADHCDPSPVPEGFGPPALPPGRPPSVPRLVPQPMAGATGAPLRPQLDFRLPPAEAVFWNTSESLDSQAIDVYRAVKPALELAMNMSNLRSFIGDVHRRGGREAAHGQIRERGAKQTDRCG